MDKPVILRVGAIETNCYILCEHSGGAVIDPGDSFAAIERELGERSIAPEYILLTHGHFDHIGAAAQLREKYGCKIVIGRGDEEMLRDGAKSHGRGERYLFAPDLTVREGDTITTGALSFSVMETPGHTKGGVCYLCGDLLFCGDTLFFEECGRTDLYGGSYPEMLKSLKRLAALPGKTLVYPGHGETSDIAHELERNPYIAKALAKDSPV